MLHVLKRFARALRTLLGFSGHHEDEEDERDLLLADAQDGRIASYAFWSGVVFLVAGAIELVLGDWSRSATLQADAYHTIFDAGEVVPLLIVVFIARRKKRTLEYQRRADAWATLTVLVFMCFTLWGAVELGVSRFTDHEQPAVNHWWTALGGVVGIVSNIWAWRLRERGASKTGSRALRTMGAHARLDALVSALVLVGPLFALFGWFHPIVDGTGSLLVAVLIARSMKEAGVEAIRTLRRPWSWWRPRVWALTGGMLVGNASITSLSLSFITPIIVVTFGVAPWIAAIPQFVATLTTTISLLVAGRKGDVVDRLTLIIGLCLGLGVALPLVAILPPVLGSTFVSAAGFAVLCVLSALLGLVGGVEAPVRGLLEHRSAYSSDRERARLGTLVQVSSTFGRFVFRVGFVYALAHVGLVWAYIAFGAVQLVMALVARWVLPGDPRSPDGQQALGSLRDGLRDSVVRLIVALAALDGLALAAMTFTEALILSELGFATEYLAVFGVTNLVAAAIYLPLGGLTARRTAPIVFSVLMLSPAALGAAALAVDSIMARTVLLIVAFTALHVFSNLQYQTALHALPTGARQTSLKGLATAGRLVGLTASSLLGSVFFTIWHTHGPIFLEMGAAALSIVAALALVRRRTRA